MLVCGWDACVRWGGVGVVGGSRGRERYSPAPSSEIDNLSYSSAPSDATCSCGPWGSSPRCWSAPGKTPSWTWRSRGKARRRWTHRRSAVEGVCMHGQCGHHQRFKDSDNRKHRALMITKNHSACCLNLVLVIVVEFLQEDANYSFI